MSSAKRSKVDPSKNCLDAFKRIGSINNYLSPEDVALLNTTDSYTYFFYKGPLSPNPFIDVYSKPYLPRYGFLSGVTLDAYDLLQPSFDYPAIYKTANGQYVRVEKGSGNDIAVSTGLSGSSSFSASIVAGEANYFCNGGKSVIHVLDDTITWPQANAPQFSGILSTFQSLVAKYNLFDAVEGLKEATIFAPSNKAFEAISSTLSKLSDEQVVNVLKYHVQPSKAVFRKDLIGAGAVRVTQLNGDALTAQIQAGTVVINGKTAVSVPDVIIDVGAVHVIDDVLIPPSFMA